MGSNEFLCLTQGIFVLVGPIRFAWSVFVAWDVFGLTRVFLVA